MNNYTRLITTLLVGIINFNSYSQSPSEKIDFENPNLEFFEALVEKKINLKRIELNLHRLSNDSILQLAAKDQVKYIYKTNRISSEQSSKKKATPFLRVNSYDGNHSIVKESSSVLQIGEKTKVRGIRGRITLTTYEEAANAVLSEFEGNKYDFEYIENSKLYRIGVGAVFLPGANQVYTTVVYASMPYQKIEGVKYSKNSYHLLPYNRDDCRYFNREYGYLPELFSTSLNVENGRIIFRFHDINLMNSILDKRKDGLAVDIVKRDQFACGTGNRDHPSPVEHGLLLKPVKKGKLLRKNPFKEEKKFQADLGEFPPQLDPSEVELNLIVIDNKCNCETVLYNNMDSKNLRLLDVAFTIDTLSISEDIDSLSRQLNFTIQFEKNKAEYQVEDIKPILDSIQLNRFDIKEINITAFSSIEGNPAANEVLQQKRANSILSAIQQYQLKEVKTSIVTQENWDGFKTSIKNSAIASKFENKSNEEIRTLVNSDTLKFDLEPYLQGQRKANVSIIVESIYIDSLTPTVLPSKFKKAIENNEPIISKGIQTMIFKNVVNGKLDTNKLFPDFFIPFTKENMPIMNNLLAFKYKFYNGDSEDTLIESIKSEITRYFGVDPNNPHLNYNKQLIELFYWSRNIHYLMVDQEAKVDQPKDLYKAIRRLYNTKIDNWKVNQLMLNYYIIAADFYYEQQDFRMREKSLKGVKSLLKKSQLNQKQTYLMAGYFMYQIEIEWAIEIMLPFIKEGDFNEDFLFRLISIAIYKEDLVSPEKFIELLDMAKKMNQSRYCDLFGKPNMSFQLLSDDKIKSTYCNSCN